MFTIDLSNPNEVKVQDWFSLRSCG